MTNAYKGNGGPFSFTGFYLAPAPAHSDTTWMGKRSFLANIGYGFAIIYVGHQTTHLTSQQGKADADNAVTLAGNAGFQKNVIYLDIEAGGGSISQDLLNYITGWLDQIDTYASWYPGVYCSYLQNADTIKNARPNMNISFWVYRLGGKSPGCSTNVGNLTPSDSGVSYASVWQYAQNCTNQVIANIDLDMSISKDPSAV